MAAENIINITPANFQQALLDASMEKLVIIDFWADWCEPCKSLMPILEKIAAEYPQDLVLAKINCDEQQEIAMQFGIRSLPTVALFKDGQPVDGFAGMKSEAEIRELLDKYLPSADDELLAQAKAAMQQGDNQQAYTLAKQAYDLNSDSAAVRLLFAEAAVDCGRIEQARELLQSIKLVDQDSHYHHVQAKLELAEKAADSPEVQALQQALAEHPEDHDTRLKLALALHQAQRDEEALAAVFTVLKTDLNYADARKTAMDIINALPAGDPLASRYRKVLYSMLY